LFDCMTYNPVVPSSWPWTAASPMPSTPYVTAAALNPITIDFNRHNPRGANAGETAQYMNMLFCDGHAESVGAREAFRAIRFK